MTTICSAEQLLKEDPIHVILQMYIDSSTAGKRSYLFTLLNNIPINFTCLQILFVSDKQIKLMIEEKRWMYKIMKI